MHNIREIIHVGLTVTDLDRSIEFYRDVLGLAFKSEMTMEGPEADKLFGHPNAKARIAYLNGSDQLHCPPIELIHFENIKVAQHDTDLFTTSASEICFAVEDIEKAYQELKAKGVEFISEPQHFDFSEAGHGQSIAVYFKDPDGIILELTQYL